MGAGTAIWTGTCPHCGRENTAFTSAAAEGVRNGSNPGQVIWEVFMTCNACDRGIIVTTRSHGPTPVSPHGLDSHITLPGELRRSRVSVGFNVIAVNPQAPTFEAPSGVPERSAKAFVEASQNLHKRNLETSEMLSRKALDIATAALLPGSTKQLWGRIEELRSSNRITAEMADWAHEVRLDGNASAHSEEETTKENAEELLAFTETFLTYAFTLPEMIAKRRAKSS